MEYSLATARKRDLSRIIGKIVVREKARSPWIRFGLAVLLPCLGFLVNWLVFDLERAPYFSLFMATVVIAALLGGRGPGLVTTAIATVLGYLIAPPAWTFRLDREEDGIRIALFSILGCLISVIIGIVSDLQRKLNRERQTLATILQSIGDAVITADAEGRITFLNDVAEIATGWRLEAAHGKPVDQIVRVIREDSRVPVPNPLLAALKSGIASPQCTNCLLVRRDGTEIPIVYSAAPIDSEPKGIPGCVFACRDISRQREIHNALVRAEKFATVGKLSSTLAHEVNNPLEAPPRIFCISFGFAPDLGIARAYARAALQQTMRAAHAVHQTLTFAQATEKRQMVELGPLIERVFHLHSNKILAKNARVLKTCPSEAWVQADSGELEQVLSSLISNSLDAIRSSGTVCLRVAKGKGRVRVVIGDTGCGIAREHRPKLFNPFFSTKQDVGVGLGLWVTKRIIEAHNGQIRVRSSSGKGTVVRLCLAAAPISHIHQQEHIGSIEADAVLTGRRIL